VLRSKGKLQSLHKVENDGVDWQRQCNLYYTVHNVIVLVMLLFVGLYGLDSAVCTTQYTM